MGRIITQTMSADFFFILTAIGPATFELLSFLSFILVYLRTFILVNLIIFIMDFIPFRVTGRGRIGADGLAFWYTAAKGSNKCTDRSMEV